MVQLPFANFSWILNGEPASGDNPASPAVFPALALGVENRPLNQALANESALMQFTLNLAASAIGKGWNGYGPDGLNVDGNGNDIPFSGPGGGNGTGGSTGGGVAFNVEQPFATGLTTLDMIKQAMHCQGSVTILNPKVGTTYPLFKATYDSIMQTTPVISAFAGSVGGSCSNSAGGALSAGTVLSFTCSSVAPSSIAIISFVVRQLLKTGL